MWLLTGVPRSRLCRPARRQAKRGACHHRARPGAPRTRAPSARSAPPASAKAARRGRRPAAWPAQAPRVRADCRRPRPARGRARPGAARRDAFEQLLGIGCGQAAQLKDRQPGLLERCRKPLAKACDEYHRLVLQPPCDEGQHVKARTVEPLCVVRDQQQWARVRRVGNKSVGGKGDAERIRLHQVVETECCVERLSLGIREPSMWLPIGPSSWCSPAKASSDSDSTPTVASVRAPKELARPRARSSKADFPIPGSPQITSAPPRSRTRSRSASTRAISSLRPISSLIASGELDTVILPRIKRKQSHDLSEGR